MPQLAPKHFAAIQYSLHSYTLSIQHRVVKNVDHSRVIQINGTVNLMHLVCQTNWHLR